MVGAAGAPQRECCNTAPRPRGAGGAGAGAGAGVACAIGTYEGCGHTGLAGTACTTLVPGGAMPGAGAGAATMGTYEVWGHAGAPGAPGIILTVATIIGCGG